MCYCHDEDYNLIVDVISEELVNLKLKHGSNDVVDDENTESVNVSIEDPIVAKPKGCDPNMHSSARTFKWNIKCHNCGGYMVTIDIHRANTQGSQPVGQMVSIFIFASIHMVVLNI